MKKIILNFVFVLVMVFSVNAFAKDKLTIGTAQEFTTLNPMIMNESSVAYIMYMVKRPITAVNSDWEWACWLCKEIPTQENGKVRIVDENGKKKLYADWEIIEGAKWGDGKPVTGLDVKLGWEIGKSNNVTVAEKDWYTRVEDIIIDKENPKKFTLKFAEPRYNYFHLGHMRFVPAHIEGPIWEKTKNEPNAYEKQTAYVVDPTNAGLYNGPYLVSEVKLGSHVIMDKNPNFYGTPAKIKRVIVKLIEDTATLEANLLSGTIDVINEVGLKFDQAASIEQRLQKNDGLKSKFKVLYRDGAVYEHIDLNLDNEFLKEKSVRQALMYAADRERMVQAIFNGKLRKAIHDVHPKDVYFTENVEKYPYDLEKAKTILDQAGWKLGDDGYRYKDGKKLSLLIGTTAHDKTRELVQVFLQNEWRKAGIELKIKNAPARVFFGELVRKRAFDGMTLFAWLSNPDNPPHAYAHSHNIPTKENSYSGINYMGWKNAVVDKTMDEVLRTFDLEKRKALMQTYLKEYTKDIPVIPLYYRKDNAVVPSNLKNYVLTGHQYMSTMTIENWEWNDS